MQQFGYLSGIILCSFWHWCHGASLSEILSFRSERCVIALMNVGDDPLIVNFFHQFTEEFTSNLTLASVVFRHCKAPFNWNENQSVEFCVPTRNIDHTQCKSEIVAYKRTLTDLKCLYAPTYVSKGEFDGVYSGPLNEESFLSFINSQCDTFFDTEGNYNEDGVIKSRLENDLVPKTDVLVDDILSSNKSIPRCAEIPAPSSEEFLTNYLSKSQPVIIRDAVTHWPAINKWDFDLLRSAVPSDRKVHVKVAPFGQFEGVERASLWDDYETFDIPDFIRERLPFPEYVVVRPGVMSITFGKFLEFLETGEFSRFNATLYLEYSSISYYLEEIQSDFSQLPFIADWLRLDSSNVWLSDGNTLGKLHFDPFDNILAMVEGEKELTLFDPFSNENLYESHIQEANLRFFPSNKTFQRRGLQDSTSIVMSPVDISKPDLKRFPKYLKAKPVKCRIKKGDALFLPAFWWHEVQSFPSERKFNMAINFWYHPLFDKRFPCQSCPLYFNPVYRSLLSKLRSLAKN